MRHRLPHSVLICLTALLTLGCGREYRQLTGVAWHTTYSIVYQSDRDLTDSIVAIFPMVEKSLSPFLPDSRISAINSGADSVADALIAEVLSESVRINRLSGGAFDPTVSPLVNLWGFGYTGVPDSAPDSHTIDSVLEFVGISDVALSPGMVIRKPDPRMQFNFSAITKGYGCDIIGQMFRRNGVNNFMVEIGGEIVTSGRNPRGRDWHIQIDAPDDKAPAEHERMNIIPISGKAVATSGNYRNFHDLEGIGRVGHTISPVTGRPVMSRTLQATVIAPTAMQADALATAAMVMDPDSALAMIRRFPGAEILLVLRGDDPGTLNLRSSGGFP